MSDTITLVESVQDEPIVFYVITYKTKDYGDKYVVRRHALRAEDGVGLAERTPVVVAETLEQARAHVPAGLVKLDRHPTDDPVIVESWMQ